MTNNSVHIMGIFTSQSAAATAIDRLRATDWTIERVHGPIPSHAITKALRPPQSRVGWFTLAGGIVGFFVGLVLAIFTATRWSLIVSGKPVVALVPFFIVGFEFTILFAIFGNVLGLLHLARLPRLYPPPGYDARFTADCFGVLACCAKNEQDQLARFFLDHGAEIKRVGEGLE